MSSDWKPQGYSTVSVYLVAEGAQRVIDFLKRTFDATKLRRFDTPEGKIVHAELRIGDTVVMIADAGGSCPAFPVWLHVYVPDVDATYKKAVGNGRHFGSGTRSQGRRPGSMLRGKRPEWEHMVDRDASRIKDWTALVSAYPRSDFEEAHESGGGRGGPPPKESMMYARR